MVHRNDDYLSPNGIHCGEAAMMKESLLLLAISPFSFWDKSIPSNFQKFYYIFIYLIHFR